MNTRTQKWVTTLATAITAVILSLASPAAEAGSYLRYGLGVFRSASEGRAETKAFSFGYEERWLGPLVWQAEGGGFFDVGGAGRKSSGFGNVAFGVEAAPEPIVLRPMVGAGAITTPDSLLGGWFEFNEDLLVGLRDKRGNMVGLNYKHISSAGIYDPNYGRDFVMLHVEIPW